MREALLPLCSVHKPAAAQPSCPFAGMRRAERACEPPRPCLSRADNASLEPMCEALLGRYPIAPSTLQPPEDLIRRWKHREEDLARQGKSK